MALPSGILFKDAVTYCQFLTRDNGNVTQFATAANLVPVFNKAVVKINHITRSRVISNLETPIIYQGPPVVTSLSASVSAGGSSMTVLQTATIIAGMSLVMNDSNPAHVETVTVANSYVQGQNPVPITGTFTYNHAQGTGVASTNRLYDFPTGMNSVYQVDFNGIPLIYGQLDTLYPIYSIFGQSWYAIKGYPKYWYQDGSKFGIFPNYPTSGLPIRLWSVSDPSPVTSSADTTTTTQLDQKLDDAITYKMCELLAISRRELTYAKVFSELLKSELLDYEQNQNERQSRDGVEFLDHTMPYLTETF